MEFEYEIVINQRQEELIAKAIKILKVIGECKRDSYYGTTSISRYCQLEYGGLKLNLLERLGGQPIELKILGDKNYQLFVAEFSAHKHNGKKIEAKILKDCSSEVYHLIDSALEEIEKHEHHDAPA